MHEYLHKNLENMKKNRKKFHTYVTWGPWASWGPPAARYEGFFLRLWLNNCTPYKGPYMAAYKHTVLHSKTAGQLTWRIQNAPKFLAAGALPLTPLGWGSSGQRRSRKPPIWWRLGGAVSPLSKNPGSFGLQSFGPLNLASSPHCWFRSDATALQY